MLTLPCAFTVAQPYSQLVVFRADVEEPFSFWSQRHHEQGFVLRDGSLSFRTRDAVSANVRCAVAHSAPSVERSAAEVFLRLPFTATAATTLAGSIIGHEEIDLVEGTYDVYFELFPFAGRDEVDASITFVSVAETSAPRVLRHPEFDGDLELLGEPA